MSYQSFLYNGMGKGLNLRDKPDAVDQQECIDGMNVGFLERGAIVTRGGYQERVATAINCLGSYENSGGTKRLLVGTPTTLRAYATSGGAPTTTTTPTDPSKPFSFARFGTPSSERVYMANGVDARYYNGSTFQTPANFPKGANLCVQNTDNRLVSSGFLGSADGPSGALSSPSHVYFSDPGDPATWDPNNFEQLTPGDGEKITGSISWRELTFVFKESRFFVFYGNSVDGAGDPIFNYRAVDIGAGLVAPAGLAIGVDGVYFVAEDGLYRSTGSNAVRVSDLVSPLWNGQRSGFYTGGVISDLDQCVLTSYEQRIYMAFPSDEGQRVLAYDPQHEWFSLYDLPAKFVHGFNGSLWFGDTFLAEHQRTMPDDDGDPIVAYWRSGWNDFGSPDVKVLRKSKMWGVGTVFSAIAKDFEQDPGVLELVNFAVNDQPQWNEEQWNDSTWAEPRGLSPKQRLRATRGTTFSTLIRGEAPWALHRIDHLVRQVRQPGIED